MRYCLLFFFTVCVTFISSINAQDVILYESEKYDDNMVNIAPVKIDNGYLSLIVEYKDRNWEDPKMNQSSIFNKNFNYNYISDEGNVYIAKMDMDLNIIEEEKLTFDDAHDLNIYGMFNYEGKTTLYYSQRKNFNNEVHIYSMDINIDNLKRNRARNIHTIRYRNGVPATRLVVSPDSTKLAFISERWLGNKDEVKLDVALFNIQGTPIWSDPVYLDAKSEKVSITDAALDNTGNIYISYKLFDKYTNERSKKNKNGDKVPAYSTRVITFGIDETEAYVSINDEDKFIRKCNLIYNPIKDKVQAIGTYSIKDGGNLTGTFSADIDPIAMTTDKTMFYKFDKKLISLIDEDGFGQTNDKDPGVEIRTVVTNTHLKQNGDIVYILQPFKYEERFMNNGMRNNGFRNNGIANIDSGFDIYSTIVTQISNESAVYTRIPRRSNGLSMIGGLISKTLLVNDQIYLIYTDYHKNLGRDDSERPNSMRDPTRSSLILANVDNQGNYYRSFLKNRNEEDDFGLSMSDFYLIGNSEFMYTSYVGGIFSSKRQIGTVSFK